MAFWFSGTKTSRGTVANAFRISESRTPFGLICDSTMAIRAVRKSMTILRAKKKTTLRGLTKIAARYQGMLLGRRIPFSAFHALAIMLGNRYGPRGGVVTHRTANPRTPVRFRAWR